MHAFRFALRPGWLVVHVVALALAITMIFLGRWQLHVSESRHFSLQNFGYSIQWWLFAVFTLALWARLMRDLARRADDTGAGPSADAAPASPASPESGSADASPVAYRRYVMPSAAATAAEHTDADPVRSAYNDYLAALNAADAEDAR